MGKKFAMAVCVCVCVCVERVSECALYVCVCGDSE